MEITPSELNVTSLDKTSLSDVEEQAWEGSDHSIDKEEIRKWIDKNKNYNTIEYFEKWVTPVEGKVLELGAGHCWLSGQLSKRDSVHKVCALELSRTQLERHAPPALEYVDADLDKMEFYCGDFLNLSSLPETDFDLVIFDSAFHHTYHPIELLHEVRSVLLPDGYVLLQREPKIYPKIAPNRILGPWGITSTNNQVRQERQRETPEHNELIYSIPEYELFAHLAGLELDLHPQLHNQAKFRSLRAPIVSGLDLLPKKLKKIGMYFHTRWFITMSQMDTHPRENFL